MRNMKDEEGNILLDEDGNPKTEIVSEVPVKRKKKIGQPIEYPKNRKFKKSKKSKL